jgi:hypothetical protein
MVAMIQNEHQADEAHVASEQLGREGVTEAVAYDGAAGSGGPLARPLLASSSTTNRVSARHGRANPTAASVAPIATRSDHGLVATDPTREDPESEPERGLDRRGV